jgi:hypothetical protein
MFVLNFSILQECFFPSLAVLTFLSTSSGAFYLRARTPDVSPMFLTSTISGTRLTLKTGDRTVGEFSFTTDIITGTWSDHWSMVYEQEVYTATTGLILARQ